MELFRTFKKYDRNMNGTLDFSEYTQCLSECPGLNLTKQEIITTALAADLNCDGCIDFEEFMKHFTDVLDMINYQRGLQEGFLAAEQQDTILEKNRALLEGQGVDKIGDKAKKASQKVQEGSSF
jgi:hypothetical protein